jgi:hypoxanthine phosphoribosyltransferase
MYVVVDSLDSTRTVRFLNNISMVMTFPERRVRAATMEQQKNNDDNTEEVVDTVAVVTHETLKPPVRSVSAAVSKTTEFEWKLTKLPLNPNDVEAIKFETRVDEKVRRILYFHTLVVLLQHFDFEKLRKEAFN